ncbi:D-2-hydroxyacid dehydrogenase [Luteimonas vadosa]|uniref:D-2-hydroxyacid dehydrogenase n=1 Tax=Luteimonas vadosa TaxID=1165507 RepID=A0ABP9E997_9GAMM
MKAIFPLLASLPLVLALQAAPAAEPMANPQSLALVEQLGLQEADTPSRDYATWARPRKVAVLLPASWGAGRETLLAQVRAAAGGAEVVAFDGTSLEVLADADVVLGVCSPDVLEAAPRLRWLHSYSVGVERCTRFDGIDRHDFVLTNNQRVYGPDIAEHAIALMLALSRNLGAYGRAQRQGQWLEDAPQSMNVEGRTLLVLGLGGIGTEIARRAHALGMRVVATRNSSREGPDFVEQVGLPEEASTLAAKADFIVNALPLTDDTAGRIDRAFFAAAKPGARYISVGRGGTTDTPGLVDALQSGQIGGAGLDVTEPEPLPAGHPLWTMENVLITPHVAGRTDEARERAMVIAIENLRRYSLGEPLLSVVDLERGY